jgi:hypothetical protein
VLEADGNVFSREAKGQNRFEVKAATYKADTFSATRRCLQE